VTEAFLDQASSKFSLSFSETGGVVDEFRRQMRACVKLLTSPYGKLLSTLLGGIQIDGQLAEAFRSRWFRTAPHGSEGSAHRRAVWASLLSTALRSPALED
jgi:hypothetical protein